MPNRSSERVRRVQFATTAVTSIIFAAAFAFLEYYYVKDPALQVSNHAPGSAQSNKKKTKPVLWKMYRYHLFPMFFIFVLNSFTALWDDLSGFYSFEKHSRLKAAKLGVANLAVGLIVEDIVWFVSRLLAPLKEDPKGGKFIQSSDWTSKNLGAIDLGTFAIPNWYIGAGAIAAIAYYSAFRKEKHR